MKSIVIIMSAMLFVLTGTFARLSAQSFTYELLPGATITPADGATTTGPSEPLSGSFTWTNDPGNSNSTIHAFYVTSLSLTSADFTFSLASNIYTGQTQNDGTAYFDSLAYLTGTTSGTYTLGSIYAGSYTGSATAPTDLDFATLGVAPAGGGLFIAHASFQAVLETPEPSGAAYSIVTLVIALLLLAPRFRSSRAS